MPCYQLDPDRLSILAATPKINYLTQPIRLNPTTTVPEASNLRVFAQKSAAFVSKLPHSWSKLHHISAQNHLKDVQTATEVLPPQLQLTQML